MRPLARRFLKDLPRGLDTFNDVCMQQQADSSVLEDNKKQRRQHRAGAPCPPRSVHQAPA